MSYSIIERVITAIVARYCFLLIVYFIDFRRFLMSLDLEPSFLTLHLHTDIQTLNFVSYMPYSN